MEHCTNRHATELVEKGDNVFLGACALLTLVGLALRITELAGLWGGA